MKLATNNWKVNQPFYKPKYQWVDAMMKSYQEQNPYQNLTDVDLMYLENAFRPDSPVGKHVWNKFNDGRTVCNFLVMFSGNANSGSATLGTNYNFDIGYGLINKITGINTRTINHNIINTIYGFNLGVNDYNPVYLIRDFSISSGTNAINYINNSFFNSAIDYPTASSIGINTSYHQIDGNYFKGTLYFKEQVTNAYYISYRNYNINFKIFENVVFENENVIDSITTFLLFNNNLGTENINRLLIEFWESQQRNPRPATKVLNLGSPASAPASGSGLTAKQNLIDAGWTVTTN